MGMCCTASIASRFSVSDTGSPAARSSWMNPARRSSIGTLRLPVEPFGVGPVAGFELPDDPLPLGADGASLLGGEHTTAHCFGQVVLVLPVPRRQVGLDDD